MGTLRNNDKTYKQTSLHKYVLTNNVSKNTIADAGEQISQGDKVGKCFCGRLCVFGEHKKQGLDAKVRTKTRTVVH